MSLASACGLIAVKIVCDLSCAEIPVLTPSLASIETVKAVWWRDSLRRSINDRPSFSVRSGVNARQIRPRPYFAIKLIASGVQYSAMTHRSPSFSRSSSSTRIKTLPILASAITSSIGESWLCTSITLFPFASQATAPYNALTYQFLN